MSNVAAHLPVMGFFLISTGVILTAVLSGHLTMGASWKIEKRAAINWSYERQGGWPDSNCLDGKSQSPIALSVAEASKTTFEPFSLVGYEKAFDVNVMNNGHTVVLTLSSGEAPRIRGGGLDQDYVLQEMHFHWGSEHTIEDKRYALEAHLVHYKEEYKNVMEPLKHDDGIAVLGVMFDLSPDDYDEFEKLVPIVPTLQSKLNQPANISSLILRKFLPTDLEGFYRYNGSLTTPQCNEVVVWTVFTNVIEISERQVKIFQGMHTEDSKILVSNYRVLRPLNSRTFYLNKSNGAMISTIYIYLCIVIISYL